MRCVKYLFGLWFFLFQAFFIYSQSCIPTGIQGTIINFPCNQVCSTLVFQIPHIKGTDDYTVQSIPYAAYPYNNPTGTTISSIYIDDKYSPLLPMPFSFCFYGQTYNNMVVGSNGIITFETICANANNAYTLTVGGVPRPIPYNGGAGPTGISTTYYPRTAIMGAYHDIDPSANPLPTRKIEYNVFGSPPCRKLVVSFLDIRMYSCTSLICTQQMVLHESTGIIEVFLLNKPLCANWNQGLAILGIQDETRTKAVAAPGKNCTQWSESNTGYRFTPSGTGSRYVISEMLTMSGAVVATADTLTTTAGLLDIRFSDFCPPAGTTQYVVRTKFSSCDNPANILITYDTITIHRTNNLNASASVTNSSCGPPDGSITVTVPPGIGTPPYTYVLNGGTPVVASSPYTFTHVPAGLYTIVVTDATGVCSSTLNVTVHTSGTIPATTTTSATSCVGVNNGSITITSAGGTGPYTFSLNGGAPVSGTIPFTFQNLPAGNHNVVVHDAGTGCNSGILTVNVATGTGVSGSATTTPAACPGVNNGTITVTALTGTAPFQWSLNGGPFVPGTSPFTFTNVSAGNHHVVIKDANNCSILVPVNVGVGPGVSANVVTTSTTCPGVANGTITVNATSGVSPFTYQLNGGAPQAGANPFTFTGVPAGNHTVLVSDAIGCVSSVINVLVTAGPVFTTTVTPTHVLCNGGNSGIITVTPPSTGTPPFAYSLDNINWQSSNIFSGLSAGTFTVYFRESNGCRGQQTVTINEPPALTSSATTTPVTCNGGNDGKIAISAAGGISPYEYSINSGVSWQSSNVFEVSAGTYSVMIRDANGCTRTQNVTVMEPSAITAFSENQSASCDGGNDGRITVTANGGNTGGYQYSIDGINFQTSNVFNVAPGSYTVLVKDHKGCSYSFNTVVDLRNNLSYTPLSDPTICEGSSTVLNFISNATSVSWSPETGLNNTTIANPVANPTRTSQYIVTATLGRCTVTDTVIVHVNPAPVPDAGPNGFICYGQNYQLQGSGGTVYKWSPTTFLSNHSLPNPISMAPTRSITYTLSILADTNGCPSLVTDSVTVDVTPPFKVNTFPSDTIIYKGDRIQLRAIPTIQGVHIFNWSPTTNLSNPSAYNPFLTGGNIGDSIVYKVTALSDAGCVGEGFVKLRVYKGPEIYVPTAFTPNGDGKNDLFTPQPVGIKHYNYFRIYNRWGQLMFSTRQMHQGWDGTINGLAQPSGVYVWTIEGLTRDNKVIFRKGTITLIR